MTEAYEHISNEEFFHLLTDDKASIGFANKIRLDLTTAPAQSLFRVLAILFVKYDGNKHRIVIGTNSEPGYIGGSICAERSAITRLRFLNKTELLKLVIVTDNEHPIAPGPLCREFLTSVASPDLAIVLGNASGSVIECCSLEQIWPYPFLYRHSVRHDLLSRGKDFCHIIQSISLPNPFLHISDELKPYAQCALAEARRVNGKDRGEALHPVNLSSALVFTDFSLASAWMLKGLEYGCSLDPVSQLLYVLQQNQEEGQGREGEGENGADNGEKKPKLLVMVDQFGIAHAPFAQARGLLFELGYGALTVLLHDQGGELRAVSLAKLFPPPGVNAKHLDASDFSSCK